MVSITSRIRVGFLGSGQLAQMSALQAYKFGIETSFFDIQGANSPAGRVTPNSHPFDLKNHAKLVEFIRSCDVITLENEFIDVKILEELQQKTSVPILPSPKSFSQIDTKEKEKILFKKLEIPQPPLQVISHSNELKSFMEEHGNFVYIKIPKGGYDGYGTTPISTFSDGKNLIEKIKLKNPEQKFIIEKKMSYSKELATLVVRNKFETKVYPVVETVQINQICHYVLAPATISENIAKKIQDWSKKIVEHIDGIGIYAFEFFMDQEENITINESAPRPHNSGHYTMDASACSQFENHIRAILNWPLGSTDMIYPAAVMANIISNHNRSSALHNANEILSLPNSHLHLYGKINSKIGRKMGHINFVGENLTSLYAQAQNVIKKLEI